MQSGNARYTNASFLPILLLAEQSTVCVTDLWDIRESGEYEMPSSIIIHGSEDPLSAEYVL